MKTQYRFHSDRIFLFTNYCLIIKLLNANKGFSS